MTIEEAIKNCEEAAAEYAEQCKCPECVAEYKQLAGWLLELVALRAQQAPAKQDRSRWDGCYWCTGFCPGVTGDTHWDYRFCPKCGRPLTVDAWAELERRIT